MDKDISRRIWITRYFMVIGIIVLHLPPYQTLGTLDGSIIQYVKAFFSHGVFRATVPVLTVMSGYLVFISGLHLTPLKLITKKISSLFVPLLLWNLPLALAVYFMQMYALPVHNFSVELYPATFESWANAVIGLAGTPVNYPLNFLRDLFAVSLLTPLFWLLLKRAPYTGLVVVLVVHYFNLDGPFVIRNAMIVSFYIGALAACEKWDLRYLDRQAKLLLLIFVVFCIAIVVIQIQNREYFRMVAPFMVWPAMSLIVNTKMGDWLYRNSSNSFFTYLSHGPIILVLWVLFKSLPIELPYALYWTLTPVVTVILAVWLNQQFRKRMPKLSAIMLGNR